MEGFGTYRFDSEDADCKHSRHLVDHEYDEMPLSNGCQGAHYDEKHLRPNDSSIINIIKAKGLQVIREEAKVDWASEEYEDEDLNPRRVALLRDMRHLDANCDVRVHNGEEQAR